MDGPPRGGTPGVGRRWSKVVPLACLVVVVATTLLPVGAASADDVSRAEAAELAAGAARGDSSAMEHLRAVTTVDGRPVDLDAILTGDDGARSARLSELAGIWSEPGREPTGTDRASTATADRERAAAVLGQREFHEPGVPRPFRRPLQWLGERIAELWGGAVHLLAPVLGTRAAAFVLVATLVAALVGVLTVAIRRISRGQTETAGRGTRWLVDPTLDPSDLERRAAAASAAGDYDTAVRLRYEAGLLRLVEAGRLELRPDTTATGAAATVDDPTMDDITATFEQVVYGGRPATAADDSASRDGWPMVLRGRVRAGHAHAGRRDRVERPTRPGRRGPDPQVRT